MNTFTLRPCLTIPDTEDILKSLYGVTNAVVEPLSSYGDQNFHVRLPTGIHNEHMRHCGTDEFVLKIFDYKDSIQQGLIETRVEVMSFLNERSVPCSKPIMNIKGEYLSLEKIYQRVANTYSSNDDQDIANRYGLFKVLLLTYLPGIRLSRLPMPLPSAYIFDIGQFSAKLNRALQDFRPVPATFKLQTSQSNWNLDNCIQAKTFLSDLPPSKISMVEQILNEFERRVVPNRGFLRKGIIHSDISPDNIIVPPRSPSACESAHQIVGIIDFGDSVYSSLLFDVSIALAMIMLCEPNEPITVAGHFLAGYLSVFPLTDVEKQLLYVCILARLAQLQLIRIHDIKTRPKNAHIEAGVGEAWALMDKLWNTEESDIETTWLQIASEYHGHEK